MYIKLSSINENFKLLNITKTSCDFAQKNVSISVGSRLQGPGGRPRSQGPMGPLTSSLWIFLTRRIYVGGGFGFGLYS